MAKTLSQCCLTKLNPLSCTTYYLTVSIYIHLLFKHIFVLQNNALDCAQLHEEAEPMGTVYHSR